MSRIFGPPSQLASLERVNSRPVAEEPDHYKTGVFLPISLGDASGPAKYTIPRKVGYGRYSTVWLARGSRQVAHASMPFTKLTGTVDIKDLRC